MSRQSRKLAKIGSYGIEKGTKLPLEHIKAILPVIQNAAAVGLNESDIGVLLGYLGENTKTWFEKIKKQYPEAKEAWEIGKQLADIHLVSKIYQAATGYESSDDDIEYKYVPDYSADGMIRGVKPVEQSKRTKIKRYKPDMDAAKLLVYNRLADYFKNVQKITVDKRSVEIGAETPQDLQDFVEALTKVQNQRKKIESKVIEKSSE